MPADIKVEVSRFEEWYAELQRPFQVHDLHSELSPLVSGVSNRQLPIHRWFTLKEAFSAHLPGWIVEYLGENFDARISRVVDPFVGGGTTGVALAQRSIAVDGVEYNPFIRLVADTKSQYPLLSKSEIEYAVSQLDLVPPSEVIEIPALSTLSDPKYFRPSDIQTLLNVISQIRNLGISGPIRNFLLLGVATSIDDVANLRKDGRALRYEEKHNRPDAGMALRQRWRAMLEDVEQTDFSGTFQVFDGTATDLSILPDSGSYDLALYSPPYLNNFDYSEVYKLELWLLGFLSSVNNWRELRRSTLRSHPSVRFAETLVLEQIPEMADIADWLSRMATSECLRDDRTKREMKQVIKGYFDDMYLALQQQYLALKTGGYLVFIVGNSRHKSLPVATDIILGAIAQRLGFEPLQILILKKRNGRTRQKTYLRETAVIMRKV